MAPSDAPAAAHVDSARLSVADVDAGYGKKLVLSGINISLRGGEAIALLGHNGAGKTTLLQVVFGLLSPWKGSVSFEGRMLDGGSGGVGAVRLGMAMIPSERFVFPDLTVLENLQLGARGLPSEQRSERLAAAYEDFPILKARNNQRAGVMSGGEQRMVSLAMALMRKPSLLLLDEPSLGLSPAITEQLMQKVRRLVDDGTSVILVEQNVPAALSVAKRVYVLRSGRIILEERADALAEMPREKWWGLF